MIVFYHQIKIPINFLYNLKNFTNQLEPTKFLGNDYEFLRKLIYLLRQFNSLANFVHFVLIPSLYSKSFFSLNFSLFSKEPKKKKQKKKKLIRASTAVELKI